MIHGESRQHIAIQYGMVARLQYKRAAFEMHWPVPQIRLRFEPAVHFAGGVDMGARDAGFEPAPQIADNAVAGHGPPARRANALHGPRESRGRHARGGGYNAAWLTRIQRSRRPPRG